MKSTDKRSPETALSSSTNAGIGKKRGISSAFTTTSSSSLQTTIPKFISKAFPVVGAVVILTALVQSGDALVVPGSFRSNFVRLSYTILFSIAMEYVSRYAHAYLWHSKYLWWIHGSHHHQYPKVGSSPVFDHGNPFVSPTIELNDVFAVFFATVSTLALWLGTTEPSALAKDCATGMGLGVTLYGFSYFLGHDIVAHERLGTGIAEWCRRTFPYMEECASLHFRYHHKLTKPSTKDQGDDLHEDPYGPPYGFWLAPHEVQVLEEENLGYAPMPRGLKRTVWASVALLCISTVHAI